MYHPPGGQHHKNGGKAGQQDQRQGNPVHADMIVHIEGADPDRLLDKLHAGNGVIKLFIEQDGKHKGQHGKGQ